MANWFFVAMGGAIGSVLRYGCAEWVQRSSHSSFPYGTLSVNLIGCLCIGFFGMALSGPMQLREELRLALIVGLFGGFTTFATFGWETFSLLQDGQWWRAAINVTAGNVLGVFAVWIGYRLAQKCFAT